MASKITFFPVGCGDMTLVELGDKEERKILIDCNIRAAADDPDDDTRDVAGDLRKALNTDSNNRPYVDVFLLSHPDQDHCRGLQKHFYLGKPEDYPDDEVPQYEKRIFIRELWSSPIVFRRASKNHTLCEDAIAFNKEAKRRVKVNRDANFSGIDDGDRILVLGEDEDGKTDDLGPILVKVDSTFSKVNGTESKVFQALLLAPLASSEIDADEDELGKNHSSVILNIELSADDKNEIRKFLTGGDSEVVIWESLWDKYKESPSALEYDFLLSPHHCSWHSLSHDSWSDLREDAKVSKRARSALSQIRSRGKIIASSGPIKDDENDPPCIRAKREYKGITENAEGRFYCTGEEPSEKSPAPLTFLIEKSEAARAAAVGAPAIITGGLIDRIAAQAAEREPVKKDGSRRYA